MKNLKHNHAIDDGRRIYFLRKAPLSVRSVIEKSFQGKASPRQAIKANCLTCAHFDREVIRFCPVLLCPLHSYRPFQPAG